MLCLASAVHGPVGDLLAHQGAELPRLMVGFLYALSGLLSVFAVMALLAVVSLTLSERGSGRTVRPITPSEGPADQARPDQDPEAWHPDSN